MKVRAFHGAATLTFGLALTGFVYAQGAPQRPPQKPTEQTTPRPQPRQPAQGADQLRSMDGQTVTMTGCLASEAATPGQTPSPAERAGIAPDFILTNVQVRSAAPGGGGTPDKPGAEKPGAEKPGATTPSAGPSSNLKVKLEGVDNDEMKTNLNKQVEVTGRLEVEGGGAARTPGTTPGAKPGEKPGERPAPGARAGAGDDELPQLHVTTVRATGQACTPGKQ